VRLERGEPESAEVGLTPLIDIMFLLLVFFLSVTTFAAEERELDLTLPEARHGAEGGGGKALVVNVRADGEYVVDGRAVPPEALAQKLRAAAERNRDQEVLIRGDGRTPFAPVARALDLCRGAALTKVAVAALATETTGK
jgi:biopolymer transport protein ExbD